MINEQQTLLDREEILINLTRESNIINVRKVKIFYDKLKSQIVVLINTFNLENHYQQHLSI
jgi:hypothetical protein